MKKETWQKIGNYFFWWFWLGLIMVSLFWGDGPIRGLFHQIADLREAIDSHSRNSFNFQKTILKTLQKLDKKIEKQLHFGK